MLKILLLIGTLLVLSGCTDKDGAVKALKQQGYTNIHITGYTIFGCADGDQYHTEFWAKSPAGIDTKGVVCSGILKGNTIRTY